MKSISIIIIFFSNWSFVRGQIAEKPERIIIEEKQIVDTLTFYDCCCREDAAYDGGISEFYKDLKNNLKYSKRVKRVKGTVDLTIIISKEGKIVNPKIEKKCRIRI